MNGSQTTTLAILGGAMTVTYIGHTVSGQALTINPVLGLFVAGSLLLLVGLWSPELATAFAAVVLVTALVQNGASLLSAFTHQGSVSTADPNALGPK